MLLEDRGVFDVRDVFERRSDQIGELCDELVVRHASAFSIELSVQLDPGCTD